MTWNPALSRLPKRALGKGAEAARAIRSAVTWRIQAAATRRFVKKLPQSLPFSGPDLVMGCACGYQVDAVRPFVESLLGAGQFRGEAVLFVRPEDKALAAYLMSAGLGVVSLGLNDFPIRSPKRSRYFAYFKYLQDALESGRSYRCILLSDVRDVVFQKPLFESPCSELELHYEAERPRIGECKANSFLIRHQFGRRALDRLADRRISCSGTTSGRMRGILHYLAEMKNVLLSLPRKLDSGDQGVHNYILHGGLLPEARVLDNFERVASLHHVPGEGLQIDMSGQVVNPGGSVSEIVHQYDRHPHLRSAILRSFKVATES
jgi:hypothetical protein